MKKGYDNLVEAINDLRKEGYKEDFSLESNCIVCSSKLIDAYGAYSDPLTTDMIQKLKLL